MVESTPTTRIEVRYPLARGKIGLRGSHAPLSWEHTEYPKESQGDLHQFVLDLPLGEMVEIKLVRNEEEWAGGRNYVLHAGDHLILEPYFNPFQHIGILSLEFHVDKLSRPLL